VIRSSLVHNVIFRPFAIVQPMCSRLTLLAGVRCLRIWAFTHDSYPELEIWTHDA